MSPRKPRYLMWLAATCLLLAGFGWIALGPTPRDSGLAHESVTPAKATAAPHGAATAQASTSLDRPDPTATTQNPSPTGRIPRDPPGNETATNPAYAPATVQPDAAQSLAQALQYGDERSPPISHEENPPDTPTPAELSDPAAYRRYENRRQEKLYRAYEQQAAIALGEMQHDLQRARDEQLPPELIKEGEEKAARLVQTLRALRQGELGGDTPPKQ